jgi:hypothetical protein
MDAKTETLWDGIRDSFTSGGSVTYNMLSSYRRAYENPYDPNFNPQKWTLENASKYKIDEHYLSSFGGVGSEKEARALLVEVNARKEAQRRIQRMGEPAQFLASSLAALPDIAAALFGLALLTYPFRAIFYRVASDRSETHTTAN